MKIKRIAAATIAATMMVGTGTIAASAFSETIYLGETKTYSYYSGITEWNVSGGSSGNTVECCITGTANWVPGYDHTSIELTTTDYKGNVKSTGVLKNGWKKAPFKKHLSTDWWRDLESGSFDARCTTYSFQLYGSIVEKPEPTYSYVRAC